MASATCDGLRPASAQERPAYVLAVQAEALDELDPAALQALIRGLAAQLGADLRLGEPRSAGHHWQALRRGTEPSLVLEQSHFAAYRAERTSARPVLEHAATHRHLLVVGPRTRIEGPQELIGKRIATVPPPGMSALRLAALYPLPARQPRVVEAADHDDALARLERGEVTAALIPAARAAGQALRVVRELDAVPGPTLSLGPALAPALRARLRSELADAPPPGWRPTRAQAHPGLADWLTALPAGAGAPRIR
jgi:phosphonate transport system substrate-binding protein